LASTLAGSRSTPAALACLLGWIVPGGGHLYLRRRGKGLVFLFCLLALFALGVAMESRLRLHLGFDDPLAFVVSLAQMALGGPYLLARFLGFGEGQVTAVTYEYGVTFTAVAGLLNVLVILDAYDTAVGRKA
jgi:hypothetical protein